MKRSTAIAAPTGAIKDGNADLLNQLDEALVRIRREDESIRQLQVDSIGEKSLRLLRILSETLLEQRAQGRQQGQRE